MQKSRQSKFKQGFFPAFFMSLTEQSPKVSVILPFFNSVKTINRAIESIANQTYKNFELILLDDNSNQETLDIYKKFTYKAQESYRLDYIAQVELGQKKLDHSEYDTFKDFYTKGWQKFIEYNIIDVELVDRPIVEATETTEEVATVE